MTMVLIPSRVVPVSIDGRRGEQLRAHYSFHSFKHLHETAGCDNSVAMESTIMVLIGPNLANVCCRGCALISEGYGALDREEQASVQLEQERVALACGDFPPLPECNLWFLMAFVQRAGDSHG